MRKHNENRKSSATVAGFSPTILTLIRQAQTLNRLSIYGIYLAIGVFLVFGTLQSLPQFKDNMFVYNCFYLLPYGLIGLTIPVTLYVGFVLYRYRLSQASILWLCIGIGIGLLVWGALNVTLMWLAFSAWLGMAFLFRANLNRFFNFIDEQITEK